jgi:hypothetical protein
MIGRDILKFIFKNYVPYLNDIPLSLFAKEEELELFHYFKNYFEKYNELPNQDSFQFFLGTDISKYLVIVDEIFNGKNFNNFTQQTLIEEIKVRKWKDAVIKGVGNLGNNDDILKNIDKDFSSLLKAKTYDITDLAKTYDLSDAPFNLNSSNNVVKPFLKELEYMLEDGGFFSPQNIVIMGGAKSFKTGLLYIMAIDFFRKGKHVYIADVENGVQRAVLRLLQTLMGYTKAEVRDNYDKCIEQYNFIKNVTGGSLTIKGYRQKVESVLNVETDIDNIPDYKPNVIIYDYLDIMGGKNSDKRLNIQDNYYHCSSLNKKYNCFSVTVSKITDKGMYKKVNEPSHIAEDKEKLYNADTILSLSRTKEDIESNRGRICPLMLRDGLRTNIPIEIIIDADRMKITYNDNASDTGGFNERVGFDDFSERLGKT